MKKTELTQLTQIIEHLVAKEIRKQLPAIIAETFQNMMGKSIVNEQRQSVRSIREEIEEPSSEEQQDFKSSLRELFAGTPVMKPQQETLAPREEVRYSKNPMINQVLNETVTQLLDRGRSGMPTATGYSPALSMVPGFNPAAAMLDRPIMMEDPSAGNNEPAYLKNVPTIPSSMTVSRPPMLVEGQESTHAPMAEIPVGASVLDFKQHAPAAVAGALSRNYSQMMKLIDKKRGKV